MQFAQELFSLFMLAIASQIAEVGGITTEQPTANRESEGGRQYHNSFFTAIATEIVEIGLARTMEEAVLLIVPAFAHYDLLLTDFSGEEVTF
ncbi:hypothetical protein B0H67DRAFT_451449, partial [Lasiosphaeris hirsuta]